MKDNGRNGSVGFIYIDIDNLAIHNQSFGHDIGDQTITRIFKVIKQSLVKYNADCFRVGDDELLVLVVGNDSERTFDIAKALNGSILDLEITLDEKENLMYFKLKGLEYPNFVSVSTGAYITTVRESWREWFDVAVELSEKSCYFAKFGGKNRVAKIEF